MELAFDLGFDRLVDRDDGTTARQVCLFVGVVFSLAAIALAAVSGPPYGFVAGVVALPLLFCGV